MRDAVGPSDLMRFMELDQGHAVAADPDAEPLRFAPGAGSYAPVTILLYEAPDRVRTSDDTVASALRPYDDERALQLAQEQDRNVLAPLQKATSD